MPQAVHKAASAGLGAGRLKIWRDRLGAAARKRDGGG